MNCDTLPNPATETQEIRTDGDSLLRFRMQTYRMRGANIRPGAVIVVDPDRVPESGDIVVIEVNGERLCRRYTSTRRGVLFIEESGVRCGMRPEAWSLVGVVVRVDQGP